MHGVVDEKTDVFAFGVFLLEILSGRKPVDGSHQSVHSWVLMLKLLLFKHLILIVVFHEKPDILFGWSRFRLD